MFKGKILKFSGHDAIIVSDTLKYEKIKLRPQMEVGQTIYYFEDDIILPVVIDAPSLLERVRSLKPIYSIAPLLAVFLIAVMIFSNNGQMPASIPSYGIVSIDINPSISLHVNEQGLVEDAEGKNDEGDEIINSTPLIGQSLQEALSRIIEISEEKGYLAANKQIFIASTEQSDAHHIDDLVEAALERIEADDTYTVYIVDVDYDLYTEAETQKVSLGHYYVDLKTDAPSDQLFVPETIEELSNDKNTKHIKKYSPSEKKNLKEEDKIELKKEIIEKQKEKKEEINTKKDIIKEGQKEKKESKNEKKKEEQENNKTSKKEADDVIGNSSDETKSNNKEIPKGQLKKDVNTPDKHDDKIDDKKDSSSKDKADNNNGHSAKKEKSDSSSKNNNGNDKK